MFQRRHNQDHVIVLCLGWYLRYCLSSPIWRKGELIQGTAGMGHERSQYTLPLGRSFFKNRGKSASFQLVKYIVRMCCNYGGRRLVA